MIDLYQHTLSNGLRIIVNPDHNSPMEAFNIVYNVGSRDENPDRTGFAHLFEHLMFGGTRRIPEYDPPVQMAGGENNAFTNNDLTNYYLTLPYQNLETAFWIESDRMNELGFSPESLDVQKKVVCEEFRQRYLNQPYGDVWLHLRPLAYQVHPYRWPTIGMTTAHIETASLAEVKDFFYRHYSPNNAILTLSGPVEPDLIFRWAEKWFGQLPVRNRGPVARPVEPEQQEARKLVVEMEVPQDAVFMTFPMSRRDSSAFYTTDLLSDLLSAGNSSRLFQHLVKDHQIFSEIDAWLSGDEEPGLFVIQGRVAQSVTPEKAIAAIWSELDHLCTRTVEPRELMKVRNRVEANLLYSQVSVTSKAMDMGYFEWLDKAGRINEEVDRYSAVSIDDIRSMAQTLFQPARCSTLLYLSKQNRNHGPSTTQIT